MANRRRIAGRIATPPFGWLKQIVTAFVDMVEPTVVRLSRTRRWTVVEGEDGKLAIHQTLGSRTVFFADGDTLDERQRRLLSSGKDGEVELRLRADKVIATIVKMPAAGIGHVEQIVAHRLDRLTPWHPDKLLYGFATTGTPGPHDQVSVDFAATSRDIAAESIRQLEQFGLVPSRIGSAAEPLHSRLRIDLFRGSNDTARKRRRQRIVLGAAALPAASIMVFLATSYVLAQSTQQLADLGDRLTAARLLVGGSKNDGARQRDLALMDAKTADTAQFTLIDRLARIIPDTAYLEEMDIDPKSVRLVGSSTEASALIQVLESDPALADATFVAPVTRQADGRDHFDLTAARTSLAKEVAP